MGKEDQQAGISKQIKGKVNEVMGAIKGDNKQEFKGKGQKNLGKVQEKLGKNTK